MIYSFSLLVGQVSDPVAKEKVYHNVGLEAAVGDDPLSYDHGAGQATRVVMAWEAVDPEHAAFMIARQQAMLESSLVGSIYTLRLPHITLHMTWLMAR